MGASIKGLKIGLVEEGFGMPGAEEAVNQLVETTVRNMESLGAIVEKISIPMHFRGKIFICVCLMFGEKSVCSFPVKRNCIITVAVPEF